MSSLPESAVYEKVVELSKRRGFYWQSFSIYGGMGGLYDYAPLGVLLRDNITKAWKEAFLRLGAIAIDTPTLTPEVVFRASGHIERFFDLAVTCSNCRESFKVESLLKEHGIKPSMILEYSDLNKINDAGIRCPNCGGKFQSIENFSLMYKVLGRSDEKSPMYLRPETAQGVFVNFRNLFSVNRERIPMMVMQLGKGYRNEIAPRQSLVRLRELLMGEVEVYTDPDAASYTPSMAEKLTLLDQNGDEHHLTASEAVENGIIGTSEMGFFIEQVFDVLRSVGIDVSRLRFRKHTRDELSHYSKETWDAEFLMDTDWIEITGIADRGTFDLEQHMKMSGADFTVNGREGRFTPRVYEPAFGIDRIFLMTLVSAYRERENGFKLLSLKREIAPYHCAVLPLQKKDGIDTFAKELFNTIRMVDPYILYDDSGSIGRRYARQDEIGTPYCITVDYDSLNDRTVTIRERDSTKQIRIAADIIADLGIFSAADSGFRTS